MSLRNLIPVLLALAGAGLLGRAAAQEPPPLTPSEPLRVFLDCQRCDFDYLRREITFVNYVRDRADAQLHVLVTSQSTGGGGNAFTLFFLGHREFAGRQDTLLWVSRQDATDDQIRAGLTRTLTLGLVPFAARTPISEDLSIQYDAPDDSPRALSPADPWNLWVFRFGVGAAVEGERRQSSASIEGSVAASRTTNHHKVDVRAELDYAEDSFELSSGEKLTSIARDHELESTVVWSLTPHWSAGLQTSVISSTRLNQDLGARLAPAIEYNVYPYAESSRRQILFLYAIGPVRYDYEVITLFDRLTETRMEQRLDVFAGFEQPWGEVDVLFKASSFLHDARRHRLDLFSNLEIRLFRGLSLDLEASVARIKDQLYLPREDIPDEEVLLRRRALGTDYEYEIDIGFSYTFGSVFNNIVNPRMAR